MEINQRPTPQNEWLYEQSFVPNPEMGEPEEVRSNWCTQHMGEIPDDAPVTDWPKYLYHECTTADKAAYEAQWAIDHPEESATPDSEVPTEPSGAEPAQEEGGEA